MITLIVFILVLSILVIIHEMGHFLVAKKNGVYVEEFGFGLPPRIFGIKRGETLFSLNWLPFGGFVKVLGEEYHEGENKKIPKELRQRTFFSKGPRVKIAILTAGVLSNFILGWLIVSYLFTQGVPVPSSKIIVEKVAKNSPAEKAGIWPNDLIKAAIIGAGRQEFKNTDHFIVVVKKLIGQPVTFITERDGRENTITIIPRKNPPSGEGALGVILSPFIIKKYSMLQAPFFGLIESVKITGMVVSELGRAIAGFVLLDKQPVQVAGPIGIVKITSQAVQYGFSAVLQLVSLLSLNLAVINILPFPALDGGRVAFVLYETIMKRRINPIYEKRLNMVGFAILLSLIGLVTINDLIKLL